MESSFRYLFLPTSSSEKPNKNRKVAPVSTKSSQNVLGSDKLKQVLSKKQLFTKAKARSCCSFLPLANTE